MFHDIIEFDQQLLLAINGAHCSYADNLMCLISSRESWLLIILSLLFVLRSGWKRALVVILIIAIVITLADQISSTFIKPLVARFRPTHDPGLQSLVHVVDGYRSSLYGFVSSHAANSFAAATTMAFLTRNRHVAAAFAIWAAITCYSRMYLGVHFPGDILGGTLLGIAVALAVGFAAKASPLSKFAPDAFQFTKSECKMLACTVWINMLIISILALVW